jgi:drug/metabolite transporter (DMT)-like permease
MSERDVPVACAPGRGQDRDGADARRIVRGKEKTEPAPRTGLVAWGSLLIVWVVWGSTYLSIRVGDETIPPLVLASVRYLIAGLIMFPVAVFSPLASGPNPPPHPPSLRRLPSSLLRRPWGGSAGTNTVQAAPRRFGSRVVWPGRAEWLGCAVVGILLLGANGAVCVGETTVPSGLTALLIATVPLWLLGMDAVLNHARLGLAPVAGLAIGLAGVGLLSGLGSGRAGVSASGVAIILCAAAAWALGTIMARRVRTPASPALTSAMQLLIGGAVLLVLATATGEFGSFRLSGVSDRSWLALGYLIVAGSIVAFSAYVVAVRMLPTATVATYAYVNPVIAVLLGTLILNERVTPGMLAGGVLVVGAVILVVRRSPPAH